MPTTARPVPAMSRSWPRSLFVQWQRQANSKERGMRSLVACNIMSLDDYYEGAIATPWR